MANQYLKNRANCVMMKGVFNMEIIFYQEEKE